MSKFFIGIILFVSLTMTANATDSSVLGLDYQKITKNKILTEVMLEIEPKLIEYYEQDEYAKFIDGYVTTEIERVASNLFRDSVRQSLIDDFKKVAPEAPLRFLELDKKRYPNLWHFGNIVRLTKIEAESLKLYKALHGKDYVKAPEK